MSKHAISTFNFQSNVVRVEIKDNEPLFCLTDVLPILGLQARAISKFQLNPKGVAKLSTPSNGGNQEVTFIDEPNLYRVIFRSNKVEARQFQDWVFEEVLPSIRKTGSYTLPTIEYATPAQKQEVKSLINDYVRRTQKTWSAAWRDVFDAAGFNKLENLTVEAYPKAIEFLSQGFKKALPNPHIMQVAFDTRRAGEYRVNVYKDGTVKKMIMHGAWLQEDYGMPYGDTI